MKKEELIKIKLERAKKTFDTAQKVENGDWNSIANRLYYTVFYLAPDDIVLDEMTVKPYFSQVQEFMDIVELHLQ